jgi:hypothetical protein
VYLSWKIDTDLETNDALWNTYHGGGGIAFHEQLTRKNLLSDCCQLILVKLK